MSLETYLEFLGNLVRSVPFNSFDYILLLIFFFYIIDDIYSGITIVAIRLFAILTAFFSSLFLYTFLSKLLTDSFHFTKGVSDASSFLLIGLIIYILLSNLVILLRKKIGVFQFPLAIERLGGFLLGAISFFFVSSFLVSILLSFPVAEQIKNSIRNSFASKILLSNTQIIENSVKNVFGGAVEESINFLTVKPESNQLVKLNFTYDNPQIEESEEKEMIRLVNIEREKRGLTALSPDSSLREAARRHAEDMLKRGYFSHFTPEGISPFDRLDNLKINYNFAGENIAFTPDAHIAMEGLMNSQGHRENILSPNFKKIGVGVLDAGIFGKMFVQEFTD